MCISGISEFRLCLAIKKHKHNLVEPGDIESVHACLGISFLAVLCAEIVLLPVWAAVMSISGI